MLVTPGSERVKNFLSHLSTEGLIHYISEISSKI